MKLRMLNPKDAPLMLEWMHDDFVVHDMKNNFAEKTIDDCITFIKFAADTTKNIHLAITDENDIYMGTVSLKHIENATAEFGITIRRCAMGLGYSKFGMDSIIEKGFKQIGLNKIYWCVSPKNERAVKFYEKNEFNRIVCPKEAKLYYAENELNEYIWYCITSN